jgi:transposase
MSGSATAPTRLVLPERSQGTHDDDGWKAWLQQRMDPGWRPLLPVPGWLRGRGGQPEAYCHRAMLDAIRYLVDNGIKWRAMPADFPRWDRVTSRCLAGLTGVVTHGPAPR